MTTAHAMIRCLTRQYGRGDITYEELWSMIDKVLKQETEKPPKPEPVEDNFDDSWDEAIRRTQESIRRLKALHQ